MAEAERFHDESRIDDAWAAATQAFERMRPWLSEYRLARYAEVFGG